MIKMANANLWHNKSRTFLTVLAIFVGAFTVAITTSISSGVNNYIDKQMAAAGGDGVLQVMSSSSASGAVMPSGPNSEVKEYTDDIQASKSTSFSSEDVAKIKSIEGVKSVKSMKMPQAQYIQKSDQSKRFSINVSPLASNTIRLDLASGRNVQNSETEAEIVLPKRYLKPLGYKDANEAIGQTVNLGAMGMINKKLSNAKVKIVGIQNPSVVGFGNAYINDTATNKIQDITMANMPNEYRDQAFALIIELKKSHWNNAKINKFKATMKDKGYEAVTLSDIANMVKAFFSAITAILTVFASIALLAASMGVINTLYISVEERTRQIGLMKSMGLGRLRIFSLFSIEAVLLGFWGSVLAVIVAYLTQLIVNPIASETILINLPGFILIQIDPVNILYICLSIMLLAFLSGTLPALRASKKDPIEALRYE